MTDHTMGTVAMHDRIADDLRARISRGEFKPGDKLPSAKEVRAQWGCSDRPVREAFAILLGEGRITSGRGAPARVRIPPNRDLIEISVSSDLAQAQKDAALLSEEERRGSGTAELALGVPLNEADFDAEYERISADSDLAKEFDLPVGAELLRREYKTTHKQSGRLLLHSISYIPVELIKNNAKLLDKNEEPWPGGHWHQLYTVGIEIDRLENSIIAIQPTTRQRQDWDLEPGVPLFCSRSRSVDISDRVVSIGDSIYPADRTTIRFTVQLKRWESS